MSTLIIGVDLATAAERRRLGRISKRGDVYVRSLLVNASDQAVAGR